MLLKLPNNLFQVRISQIKEIFILQKILEADTGAELVHIGAEDQTGQEVTRNGPKKALSRILNISKSSDSSFTSCGIANHVVKWSEITRNPWILDSIMGYNIEFERKPFQKKYIFLLNLIKIMKF